MFIPLGGEEVVDRFQVLTDCLSSEVLEIDVIASGSVIVVEGDNVVPCATSAKPHFWLN